MSCLGACEGLGDSVAAELSRVELWANSMHPELHLSQRVGRHGPGASTNQISGFGNIVVITVLATVLAVLSYVATQCFIQLSKQSLYIIY